MHHFADSFGRGVPVCQHCGFPFDEPDYTQPRCECDAGGSMWWVWFMIAGLTALLALAIAAVILVAEALS